MTVDTSNPLVEYFVLAEDGKEYGPASVDTLREWATDGRLSPTTRLRDSLSGTEVSAGSVNGIFVTPPVNSMAAAPVFHAPMKQDEESFWPFGRVILESVLAIVLFFVLHGIGLIFAAYAMYYAVRLKSEGSKYGIAAVVIAGLALVFVGIGWILRLSGTGV